MPVPQALLQWLKCRYPKPEIDQEWLSECYNYVQSQPGGTNLENAKQQVEAQLLASDLRDSTIPHTALPATVGQMENSRLPGPYLVQILALTDIGHSAFQLKNTRQIRQERADMSALATENENEEEGEEEGPVPDYPRGMLRFELSDGSTLLPAIEYRKLSQLVLGVTPLGCKLLLSNVLIRTGIAFLEPKSVVVKGSLVDELDASQDSDFVKGLNRRLGQPEENGGERQNQPSGQRSAGQGHGLDNVPDPEIEDIFENPDPTLYEPQPPTARATPMLTGETAVVRESPYFSSTNASTLPTSAGLSASGVRLSNLSSVVAQTTSATQVNRLDYSSDGDFRFRSDEIDADFLAELDSVEQQALGGTQSQGFTTATANAEVIDLIDGSDKENIQFSQIRSSQRRPPGPDDEVIDISD